MNEKEIREHILGVLKEKLVLFDISPGEVNDGFDLVKSGLLDSMSFVDLVAGVEDRFGLEIDFERAADDDTFTTIGGLLRVIRKFGHER
jgi:acyl carrier protein